jgi:hypothetical protein
MSPKFDFVTQDKIRKETTKLIIGFQVGVWGVIFRAGLYF